MATRSDLKWAQLKLGVMVVVSVVALVVVIFEVTGQTGLFQRRIHLIAYVPNAAGLRSGANVNLQGVTIGNVSGVRLVAHPPTPGFPVRIDMKVSANHPEWLRTDSQVELGTTGPLGERLVNIYTGTPPAPPATNGTVLKARVAVGINALLVSTHSVVQNANYLLQRIGAIVDQIQSGRGSIGQLIYRSDLYNRMDAVATNLQALSGSIKQGRGTLGKLVTTDTTYRKLDATLDRANSLLNQIQNGQGTMAELIRNPSLYRNANQLVANLNQTTTNLNRGQGALGAIMTNSPTSAKLKATIARLDALLAGIEAGQGTAGQFVKNPALYRNLNQTLVSAHTLIQAMRTNPKRYLTIHLKIF